MLISKKNPALSPPRLSLKTVLLGLAEQISVVEAMVEDLQHLCLPLITAKPATNDVVREMQEFDRALQVLRDLSAIASRVATEPLTLHPVSLEATGLVSRNAQESPPPSLMNRPNGSGQGDKSALDSFANNGSALQSLQLNTSELKIPETVISHAAKLQEVLVNFLSHTSTQHSQKKPGSETGDIAWF